MTVLKLRRPRVLAPIALAGVIVVSSLTVVWPSRTSADGPEQACAQPARRMTLYAQEITQPGGPIRLAWGRTPSTASIPGPLIELLEGDCVSITVVNNVPEATLAALRQDARLGCGPGCALPLGVSLHVHGVKYTRASDGTLVDDFASGPSLVPSGRSRTFNWYAAPRVVAAGRVVAQGTAGYWWYHDHVVGTAHGTGGVASGLFGGVVVRRAGDLRPDVSYTVAFGPDQTINLERHPDTDTCTPGDPQPGPACFVARAGQRVEFVAIGTGDDFHTFHLHGHNWANNRTGILSSPLDDAALIDNRTLGPADSFGFQVIAGQDVGPGKWMLHCHVQSHSDLGMMTFFNVLPDRPVPLDDAHAHVGHDH